MKTLLRDSNITIPGVRRIGHQEWFRLQAQARGFVVSDQVADHPSIEARVDHGRWIADCPLSIENQPCNGAECVTDDDKVFICLSCGNTQVNGQLIPVVFPSKNQRHKFEKSLALRPEANRNWFPGETPKKIAKENRKHKIPVPEGAE